MPPLLLLLETFGADRVLFSADYPFLPMQTSRDFLDQMPVSAADREKIAHGNADRLLKLKPEHGSKVAYLRGSNKDQGQATEVEVPGVTVRGDPATVYLNRQYLLKALGFGLRTVPKAGSHSVGVQRQYCGALGKKAICQAAVSLHYVGRQGHVPLGLRLFLPESWLEAPARLDKAGVPEDKRRALSKGEIALELLDTVRGGERAARPGGRRRLGLRGQRSPCARGLAERGLHYVLGVTGERLVFIEEPRWQAPGPSRRARPRLHLRLEADSPRPLSLREAAAQTPRRKVTWREGTKGPMAGRFAWLRVWPAHGWATGDCAHADPIWLLIEEAADGTIKYAFSNLPVTTSRIKAVQLWRERWKIEQGYQQMKEELGLDHFEGRSWRGLPPPRRLGHARLRLPGARTTPRQAEAATEKKSAVPPNLITLPSIRRALQQLLAPRRQTRLPLLSPLRPLRSTNGVVLTPLPNRPEPAARPRCCSD